MKGMSRKSRLHFMFASTLLRVEIKNSVDTKLLARGDKEKYKPLHFQEPSEPLTGILGFLWRQRL